MVCYRYDHLVRSVARRHGLNSFVFFGYHHLLYDFLCPQHRCRCSHRFVREVSLNDVGGNIKDEVKVFRTVFVSTKGTIVLVVAVVDDVVVEDVSRDDDNRDEMTLMESMR